MLSVLVVGDDRYWVVETVEALTADLGPNDLVTSVDFGEFERIGAGYDVVVVRYGADIQEMLNTTRPLDPSPDIVICDVPDQTDAIVSIFRAGAIGYVRASDDPSRLPEVLRSLTQGIVVLDRDVAQRLVHVLLLLGCSNFRHVLWPN